MAAGERVIRVPAQLGSLLRGARRQRNLSQQELAALVIELVIRPRETGDELTEW